MHLIQFVFKSDEYKNKDHCKPQLKAIAKSLYDKYVLQHGPLFNAEERNTNDEEVLEVLSDFESVEFSKDEEEIDASQVQIV